METQTRKLDDRRRHNPTTDSSLRALEAREIALGEPPPPGATRPATGLVIQSPRRFYAALLAAMSAPLLTGGAVAVLIWVHVLPPLPGLMPGFLGWCMMAACAALLRKRGALLPAMLGLVAGVPALGACFALNFQLVRVEGQSMMPTLMPGDVLLVDLRGNPQDYARPGEEIYVLGGQDVRNGGEPAIKRLVGAPGDRLEVVDGGLFINGVRARLSHVNYPGVLWPGLTLDKGQYFFMGDNPDDSRDSRYFGALAADKVLGRAVWRMRGGRAGPLR